MRRKSAYNVFIVLGTILLTLQLLLLLSLLTRESDDSKSGDYDLEVILNVTNQLNLPVITIDSVILQRINNQIFPDELEKCITCPATKPINLAIEFKKLNLIKENSFISKISDCGFLTTVLYNKLPRERIPNEEVLPICYLLKRKVTFVIIILHEREGNFWWHGDVYSDPEAEVKLQTIGSTVKDIKILEQEGALDKFKVHPQLLPGFSSAFTVPSDISEFLDTLKDSHFKECSWSRALQFETKYGSTRKTPEGRWFAHRAWKILSRAKTLLDGLGVPFWISSGTCLGYFRQCDIIPHAQDVDIGIFASDFKKQILPAFVSRGMALKHYFGHVNDSLELSFVDISSGVKLDIFFFYEGVTDEEVPWESRRIYNRKIYWNGGTQAKTGKKFKYIFPRFTLCWTEFLTLKVRIPCNTLEYILANYGPDWFTPVTTWDWKSSPPNVRPNGEWPMSEWPHVIQVYYPEIHVVKSVHRI
ncbi:hypothetical protein J437_LFUL000513 [Ladona fulva]|uniref:Ribitol-5-phosphate transferase FKTN N-terminal domain-containing protein n=1 Tax=Ladona fulva TaxID=123851 RepID=A0A8K0JTN3_LADFU|nr:hypothetical protein J437_LFUL000513 [Ladona fulva]